MDVIVVCCTIRNTCKKAINNTGTHCVFIPRPESHIACNNAIREVWNSKRVEVKRSDKLNRNRVGVRKLV